MMAQDHNKRSNEEYHGPSTTTTTDSYNHKKFKNRPYEGTLSQDTLQFDDSPYAGKSRTIYLGNVPDGVDPGELVQSIKFGPIENVRLLEGRRCAFIDFCNIQTAIDFYKLATEKVDNLGPKKFIVRGHELRVGWGKPSHLNDSLRIAIENGATRIVYYKGPLNKDQLEVLFELFGPLEVIRSIPDKSIAFIQMCSIQNAIEAISVLAGEGHKVNFAHEGKKISGSGGGSSSLSNNDNNAEEVEEGMILEDTKDGSGNSNSSHPDHHTKGETIRNKDRRTVYLGLLPLDTTEEELCNVIRGGQLQSIRISQDKKSAFVTFIDAIGANNFYQFSSNFGVFIKGGIPLKLGWGKPIPSSSALLRVLQRGATRNIYLGNIDLSRFTMERLKSEFSSYGTIESINILKEKNVAFINFTDIMDAVKAVDATKKDSKLWSEVKIGYGRDRCAQLLKTPILSSLGDSMLSTVMPPSPFSLPSPSFSHSHQIHHYSVPASSASSFIAGMGGLTGIPHSFPSSFYSHNAISSAAGNGNSNGSIPGSLPVMYYPSSTLPSSVPMAPSATGSRQEENLHTPYIPQPLSGSFSSHPSYHSLYHYQHHPSMSSISTPSSVPSSLYYLPVGSSGGYPSSHSSSIPVIASSFYSGSNSSSSNGHINHNHNHNGNNSNSLPSSNDGNDKSKSSLS